MLNQYFEPLIESAKKIVTDHQADFQANHATDDTNLPSFEFQLQQGLYVPLSNLERNKVGWSYRKSPVMIYGLTDNQTASTVHVSSFCQSLQKTDQWVWVSTDKNKAQQNDLAWCDDCFKQLNHQHYNQANNEKKEEIKETFSFLNFVQLHAHEYFNQQKLKLWQPGLPLIALPPFKQEPTLDLTKEQEQEPEQDTLHNCHLCTWQVDSYSPYLITGQQATDLGCNDSYCILCMGEHLDYALIIPQTLRWKALQERFHYFNQTCENWAHVRFHIDKSWHPLIEVMRQQGIAQPNLYHSISCEGYVNLVAPLVWKERKRAILPDHYNPNIQLPKDWDFWSYSQVLASFTRK